MNAIQQQTLLFLFLWAPVQFTFAQNIQVTIGSMDHPDITQSLICISDFQGNVYFEQFLTQDEIETGAFLNPPVPDPEHYCLSIVNEYQNDSINRGRPFIWARTFYDQSKDLHILRFEHPIIDSYQHGKSVLLDIQGAVNVDFWQHATSSAISRWQQNKNAVWAQPDTGPDEDLFVVMKSADESRYRYVYMPYEELPQLSYPKRITDAIRLDWRALRTDVSPYTVKCPLPVKFSGSIYAMNSETGNKCVFFDERTPQGPMEAINFFIPPQPLENFQAEMDWHDDYTYAYRIVHGDELSFPHFDQSKFDPSTFVVDSTRIQTKMNSFPEYFRIIYDGIKEKDTIMVGSKVLHDPSRSKWIIVGKNTSSIDFTLPSISEKSKAAFSTMERWWVGSFENIKVLEENTDIDIINFYREYNLLRVIYRDPLGDRWSK